MRRVLLPLLLLACEVPPLPAGGEADHFGRPEFDRPTFDYPRAELEPVVENIRVATFNLQLFGPSKASDPAVVAEVASIVARYDLVAVQEIKDVNQQAPYVLRDALRKRGAPHEMVLSPRTGREPDDGYSQEQYAFFYDATKLAVVGTPSLYDDSLRDRFQREPHLARFEAIGGSLDVVLVNIHTRPAAALEEIDALSDVAYDAWQQYGTASVVVLGDFNASCSYASPAELDELDLRDPEYLWVVPDDADTNVATSSCAYDRIVLWGHAAEAFEGSWGVDVGFEAPGLSDHWPVWADLENVTGRSVASP